MIAWWKKKENAWENKAAGCDCCMSKSKTLILPDQESLIKAATIYFSAAVNEAIRDRGQFLVALSSGNEITPYLYGTLGSSPYKEYIPWEKIHIFWCDEKCLPPTHADSNYSLAWQYWLKHVTIPAGNIHRIKGELKREEAIKSYCDDLQLFVQGRDWPIFDWVLLQLGSFGQVASLYPGSNIDLPAQDMVYSIQYPAMGKLADRIAISPKLINLARQVVIMVNGADQAEAFVSTTKGGRDESRWPAQRINPKDGLLVWMVDAAASQFIVI